MKNNKIIYSTYFRRFIVLQIIFYFVLVLLDPK